MILRSLNARSASVSAVLLLALSVTACGSRQENAPPANVQTKSSPSATPIANSNQAGNNTPKAKLNVNTATEAELLAAIPGLGKKMVHEFEEYRPYRSIQQFRREIGKYVSPEQVAEYEKHVYVPIAVNDSDAATLQQIPGLDAPEAQALIAARPFASNDAFLAKLAGSVSEAELAVAKTYLSGQ